MSSSYDNIGQRMEALRKQFVARTGDDLRALIEQMQDSTANDPEWVAGEAYQLMHRLAGSSGTFGCTQLGAKARALELQLKAVVERKASDPGQMTDQWLQPGLVGSVRDLLPLLEQTTIDNAETESSRLPASQPCADISHATQIFVASPDPDLTELLQSKLSVYGYTVTVCADTASLSEAVKDSCAGSAPQVFVVDEAFSEAWEKLAKLDSLAASSEIPAIFICERDDFASRYRVAALGARGCFAKPVDHTLLAERLEQLTDEILQACRGRVLILEDDIELGQHYRLVLESAGMKVQTFTEPGRVMECLTDFHPDIVLIDMQFGRYSGVAIANMIRFRPEWAGLPIIFVSSEQDPAEQITALTKGGDDYIAKPISDTHLIRTVQARCARARQLANLMSRDSLTGLLKHAHIKQELAREYTRASRTPAASVVAMLDIDHFKQVNDTYGHSTGDTVIWALASQLKLRLRRSDILGRYGGEEFMVILPDCGAEAAHTLLKELALHFSQIQFESSGHKFSVTVSGGLAEMNDYASAEEAAVAADEALYLSKHTGRNRISIAADPASGSHSSRPSKDVTPL